MAHTKTLRLPNVVSCDEQVGELRGVDRIARMFLGLRSSERMALTILAVTLLFSIFGLAVSLSIGLSLPVVAGILGALFGAPGIMLSALDRGVRPKRGEE